MVTKVRQIREVILHRIRQGEYPVGSQLPGFRSLAAGFSVHPNTLAQVYRSLTRDGVLRAEQGRGTFVARIPQPEVEPLTQTRLLAEINSVAYRARQLGVTQRDFLRLAQEAVTHVFAEETPQLFFVECNHHDTTELAKNISTLLRIHVTPLLLGDLIDEPLRLEMSEAGVIITTPYHHHEVEAIVGQSSEVISVNVTPTAETLIELSRLPKAYKVGLVCSNQATLDRFIQFVKIYSRRTPCAVHLVEEADLPEKLAVTDVVVDSQSVHERVRQLVPDKPTLTVHFNLDVNSIEYLRVRLDELLPREEQRELAS